MVDQAVVHRNAVQGPATHVLAIGVGKYPHLNDGDGALLADHQGLGQLSSPPRSARDVALWFAGEFANPLRPLASVRLLVSDKVATPFVHPLTGEAKVVPPATSDEIETAFREWKAEGDTHPDNLVIFYFCGHGLAEGAFSALLAEDFGSDPDNALDGAVDFYRNHLGMSRCKARQQLYLIDTCRTGARVTQNAGGYFGKVFVQPSAMGGTILRPILYSTLAGQKAHGRENKPSHFAEALLAGLRGAGSDRTQGDWRVRTSGLQIAIEAHLARAVKAGVASAQVPPADALVTFDLHHLGGAPEVPVIVSCKPEHALPQARLRCVSGGAVLHERQPDEGEWVLPLRVGTYDFEATFDAGPFQPGRRPGEYVWPPELRVPVEVSP